ncbi:hypothetical protein, partial [Curtobacterium herbarum]|uniref:hypothetical protein n=1 Tax=Curtobacterium herbarum TaxID=150122 RepID=UPI0035A8C131|nr:hypothetical protein [Curtobacterium herbarum]
MDASMRAPLNAVIRWALMASGIALALVLLSLFFGARPASAGVLNLGGTPSSSSQTTSSQRSDGLLGGVVSGVGGTVEGVGRAVGNVVTPTRPAPAPAPAAPAPAPAAPVPAPAAPAPAPA